MEPCTNHPERLARRRCYRCQAYICPECQVRGLGHIFCSLKCQEEWQREERRRRLGQRVKRIERWLNPLIWWRYPPFLREAWARRVILLLWLLLLTNLTFAGALVCLLLPGTRDRVLFSVGVSGEGDDFYPRWVSPPANTEGIIRARVRGGREPSLLLRNGIPIRFIPAHAEVSLEEPAHPFPSVYQLFPLRLFHSQEQWVSGGSGGTPINQVRGAKGIALTFDGGSMANQLPKILKVLREHGERATFFLTGEFIQRYPELTRMLVVSGHEVGNHTYSHPHLTRWEEERTQRTRTGITREYLQWELLRCENLFFRVTGTPMAPYWRAPYGEINDELVAYAQEIGYRHIGWTSHGNPWRSLDVLDWVSNPKSPLYRTGKAMLEQVLTLASSPDFQGGIVLMHLGLERSGDSLQDYLPDLIRGLKEKGIPLLTISELIQAGEE